MQTVSVTHFVKLQKLIKTLCIAIFLPKKSSEIGSAQYSRANT